MPFWGDGFQRYVEPFAGSSALFFAVQPKWAVISDINADLIETFVTVREHPAAVYERTLQYPTGAESYYHLRALNPKNLDAVERASRFLFLNRYCFNGLYRTNRDGHFNVPFAVQAGTGGLPPWDQFSSAAALLQRAVLRTGDFEDIITSTVKRGDFVYLDPPYAVSNRRIFRQYGSETFGLGDLGRLAEVLRTIEARGAHFIVSYAYCREAKETFVGWRAHRVYTTRNISGFSKHRRRAAELIVTNIDRVSLEGSVT